VAPFRSNGSPHSAKSFSDKISGMGWTIFTLVDLLLGVLLLDLMSTSVPQEKLGRLAPCP